MTTELIIQRCAPGEVSQALEWASKIVAYYKKTGGPQVSVLRPTTGEVNSEIVFVAQWSSMSELDKEIRRRNADSEFQAIMKGLEADWALEAKRNIFEVVDSTG
jgi:hypothetical protein